MVDWSNVIFSCSIVDWINVIFPHSMVDWSNVIIILLFNGGMWIGTMLYSLVQWCYILLFNGGLEQCFILFFNDGLEQCHISLFIGGLKQYYILPFNVGLKQFHISSINGGLEVCYFRSFDDGLKQCYISSINGGLEYCYILSSRAILYPIVQCWNGAMLCSLSKLGTEYCDRRWSGTFFKANEPQHDLPYIWFQLRWIEYVFFGFANFRDRDFT